MKRIILSLCLVSGFFLSCTDTREHPEQITYTLNPHTGGIDRLTITGDTTNMNWIMATDGSQYSWIRENYGWGLGYFTQINGHERQRYAWTKPEKCNADSSALCYHEGDMTIEVTRILSESGLTERYTFTNKGPEAVTLQDAGIYTPFNDNYPDAATCMTNRAHAHIWTGENTTYVNALRMGNHPPHVGLVLTEGEVEGYEVWERGRDKGNSQTRGVIALKLPDLHLQAGDTYTIAWDVFAHRGTDDFKAKLLERGGMWVACNRYVFEKGDTAHIYVECHAPAHTCKASINGIPIALEQTGNLLTAQVPMEHPGEVQFDFSYGAGKTTHAQCLVVPKIETLLSRRSRFILEHQQMNEPSDPRNGAYMVYDNETKRIYKNDTPNCNPADRDEGAERIGMGIFLAKQYLQTRDTALKTSLLRYAHFVRNRLQTKDYITYSSVDQKGRNRGYNYVWTSSFYFYMYKVTGDRQYAFDGYATLQSWFSQFGYGFYAIDIPVCLGLQCLKTAGMEKEYQDLKQDFMRTGDTFISNGLYYPKHEVNYEQSIVAPAVMFLTQLYLETNNEKYLVEAQRQLPVLEAFNGKQPSFHLNDIAIRHWDGYWFGKRELFGDTFPHYWSTCTAVAFYYYALCTGNASYHERARNIVRNNLCLFAEDGSASCAYLYPHRINGIKGKFYDPYANDQDWALVFYQLVEKNI